MAETSKTAPQKQATVKPIKPVKKVTKEKNIVSKENKKELEGEEKKSSIKPLDFLISGIILLVFFLCPIFFTGFVAQGIDFEKIVLFYFLVLLGSVAWVLKGVVLGELKLKRTPIDLPILATLIVFTISTFLSVSTKDSLIGPYGDASKSLLTFVIFVLFYYLTINNITHKKVKSIYWALILSVFLTAVYSLFQIFGKFFIPLEFTKLKTFNPIGTLSSLAIFLVISFPLFIVGLAQAKKIHPKCSKFSILFKKVFLGVATLTILAVLVILNNYTFWPAALVGIIIVLMFFLAKIIPISNSNLLFPLVAFLVLIVFLVLGNINLLDLNLPTEVSLSRQASWNIAKNSLKKTPILGTGPATFYYDFSKFKGPEFNSSPLWNTRFDSPSGLFFEYLATTGALGALAVTSILLVALSMCFIALIKNKSKELNSILLGLFASFVTIILFGFLFSLSDVLLLYSALIMIFTISTAMVVYPEKFKSITLSFRASPKYALALSAIFLTVSAGVVVLFTMGLKMYSADMYARKAVYQSDTADKVRMLRKSVALFPYQDTYYMALSRHYMAMANAELNGNKDQNIIGNNLGLAIETGKKAMEISPNNLANIESLALVYENASFYIKGALEWAEDLYNKYAELDPNNPTPDLRMALINMSRANQEQDEEEKKYYVGEAIKRYDQAIAKKGNLGSAYYGKGVAYERLGDIDMAIEEFKKAIVIERDNLDYKFELGRLYLNKGVKDGEIAQNDAEGVIEDEIEGEEGEEEELSVTTTQTNETVQVNDDIRMAEQLFLNIFQNNQRHANAVYSLAMLYKKIGDTENTKRAVAILLQIVDEPTQEVIKEQFPGMY